MNTPKSLEDLTVDFGSFEHDQKDLAYPIDKLYSRSKHEKDFWTLRQLKVLLRL